MSKEASISTKSTSSRFPSVKQGVETAGSVLIGLYKAVCTRLQSIQSTLCGIDSSSGRGGGELIEREGSQNLL